MPYDHSAEWELGHTKMHFKSLLNICTKIIHVLKFFLGSERRWTGLSSFGPTVQFAGKKLLRKQWNSSISAPWKAQRMAAQYIKIAVSIDKHTRTSCQGPAGINTWNSAVSDWGWVWWISDKLTEHAATPRKSHPFDVASLSSSTQCMGIAWLITFSPSPRHCSIWALNNFQCSEISQHHIKAEKCCHCYMKNEELKEMKWLPTMWEPNQFLRNKRFLMPMWLFTVATHGKSFTCTEDKSWTEKLPGR